VLIVILLRSTKHDNQLLIDYLPNSLRPNLLVLFTTIFTTIKFTMKLNEHSAISILVCTT